MCISSLALYLRIKRLIRMRFCRQVAHSRSLKRARWHFVDTRDGAHATTPDTALRAAFGDVARTHLSNSFLLHHAAESRWPSATIRGQIYTCI